jgi:hypothetical protein
MATTATITDKYGRGHTVPGPFRSISAIKCANKEAGGYFFSAASMRFFRSVVEPEVYGGRLFVTSEQFVASDGTEFPRAWKLRCACDDGEVATLDDVECDSLEDAKAAAQRLLQGLHVR